MNNHVARLGFVRFEAGLSTSSPADHGVVHIGCHPTSCYAGQGIRGCPTSCVNPYLHKTCCMDAWLT